MWRTYTQQIDWFYLEEGEYKSLLPDDAGLIRSCQFPGLWLAVDRLLAGDLATVLQVLQQGITTPEHHAFVARLQ